MLMIPSYIYLRCILYISLFLCAIRALLLSQIYSLVSHAAAPCSLITTTKTHRTVFWLNLPFLCLAAPNIHSSMWINPLPKIDPNKPNVYSSLSMVLKSTVSSSWHIVGLGLEWDLLTITRLINSSHILEQTQDFQPGLDAVVSQVSTRRPHVPLLPFGSQES